MMDQDQTLKTHPKVVVTELEGENESVLLHLETKKYYTLNKTGVQIWQLLSDGYTADEITHKLCSEYEMSIKSGEKSISNLIRKLLEEKLLFQD